MLRGLIRFFYDLFDKLGDKTYIVVVTLLEAVRKNVLPILLR